MTGFDDLEFPPQPSRNPDQQTSEDTNPSPHSNNGNRQIKKRNRIPVSCNECRRRKLRCDRKDPCTACIQRGDANGCKFTEPPSNQLKSRPGSRDFLQQRIHRLETLVTDLAAQVRHSNYPPSNPESSQSPEQRTGDLSDVSGHNSPSKTLNDDAPIDDLEIAMGDMKISDGKVTYTSGNSWNTILDEIAEIKLAMNPVYSSFHHAPHTISPDRPFSFPFFAASTPSISELLTLLPSQVDTQTLVLKFLTSMLSMCPCLHRPSFLRNLEEFYAAPDSADPIFLGTLFVVLACGISIYPENAGPIGNILLQKGVRSKKEMAARWRDASMQAFCLGEFLTNTSLENLQVRNVESVSIDDRDLLLHMPLDGLFTGSLSLNLVDESMIISIAMNMGLHRDGELFKLDPYETEMRRRIWSILVMVDGYNPLIAITDTSLNASLYGRPMMISDSQFDTKPLASMNDIDLRPGCEKPPSKSSNPESLTDTSYATCKLALASVGRKIISSLFGITPPSYDTIMKFDAEIRQLYDSFPSQMKWPIEMNQEGGTTQCVLRLGLKVVANHTLVILHRPFLCRSFRDTRYVPSREKCLDAAHEVLQLFHEYRNNLIYIEYSWYVLGALHAFHAGTVVGLRCYLDPLTCDERDWTALEQARLEFEKIRNVDGWSKLGEKAAKVFGILIRKALERKSILERDSGSKGISSCAQPLFNLKVEDNLGFVAGNSMSFSSTTSGMTGSTGLTPEYSGSLFGTPPQFGPNPLINSNINQEVFNAARLQGVGMRGVPNSDISPDQTNWDTLWPSGMNLSEWDLFFDNMDVGFSNTDASVSTGSTNPSSSSTGGTMFDQANPFGNTINNRSMEWDFSNPSYGNGGGM